MALSVHSLPLRRKASAVAWLRLNAKNRAVWRGPVAAGLVLTAWAVQRSAGSDDCGEGKLRSEALGETGGGALFRSALSKCSTARDCHTSEAARSGVYCCAGEQSSNKNDTGQRLARARNK